MNYSSHHDAVIAQCTPTGSGAIALLRLSGINALLIADVISNKSGSSHDDKAKRLSTAPSHTIHYGHVFDSLGAEVDEVLFLVMRGPHTFTGDDTVEITCHNNPFIINNIINMAIDAGARMAAQGEFSRRAVLNNKINLTQAEAINDLIHANTQQALKHSLSQLRGSLSHWVAGIEKQLIKALALSEASFEFLDEENMSFNNEIVEIINTIFAQVHEIKKAFDQQQQIRQGIRIAIIGSVNAGKSSLFNALLSQERAIVTNIPGTTRDVIEAGVYKNDCYWTLIDTAGLRTTDDVIEQLGIQRSHEQAQKADIILLVFDGSRALTDSERSVYNDILTTYDKKIIIVANKSDLPQVNCFEQHQSLSFSSTIKDNNTIIEEALQQKIATLFTTMETPFLLNQRHFNALLLLEQQLSSIKPMLVDAVSYELVSYHLKDALAILADLTGKTVSEAGMDAVFREFCVGK